MRCLMIGLIWLAVYCPALAAETHFDVNSQVQAQQASGSALFPATDGWAQVEALDATVEYHGLRLAATAWREHERSWSDHMTLSELFYDFNLGNFYLSVGKKKIDWGVGYGFRPLDMFSPVSPLALYTAVEPGVWQMSADYFTANSSLTLLCNQSQPTYRIAGRLVEPGFGCGGRYHSMDGSLGWQVIAHYDSRLKSRIGGSMVDVLGDALEVHAALLWQQRYDTPVFHPDRIGLDHFVNPVTTGSRRGAWQALAGITYTTRFQLSVIMEYWYDGRAPSRSQWRTLLATADMQATHAGENLLYSYQLSAERQMFATQNLFRQSFLLHLRMPLTHWRPQLTLVYNPQDGGFLVDGKLGYYWSGGNNVALGTRWYGGPRHAVYRQLDYGHTLYLNTELVF